MCRFTTATAIRWSREHERHKQDGVEIRARSTKSVETEQYCDEDDNGERRQCSQLHERLPPRCSYSSCCAAPLPMLSEFPLACVLIALRTRRLYATHTKQRKRRASTPLIAFAPFRTHIYCKPLHNRTDVAT